MRRSLEAAMLDSDPKTRATVVEIRKYRNSLVAITDAVRLFLTALDGEMKKPSTLDRGKRIAALANQLEMANDNARYFGLGIDFRTDRKT
jgi:hypothetical protein